jgi:hypothetical protein
MECKTKTACRPIDQPGGGLLLFALFKKATELLMSFTPSPIPVASYNNL